MHLKDAELVERLTGHGDGQLLAAVYARVDTQVGFTRMLTPLGNYLIARPAARSSARKMTEETGVPLDAAVVLGLSADALHVWGADPMLNQVHDYLGHVPVGRITHMAAEPGRSWHKLSFTLDGKDTIELDTRGAGHALVAAYLNLPKTPTG